LDLMRKRERSKFSIMKKKSSADQILDFSIKINKISTTKTYLLILFSLKALSVGISSFFAKKNSIFILIKTIRYLLSIKCSLLIETRLYWFARLFHWML
jgi:hypothetical protein